MRLAMPWRTAPRRSGWSTRGCTSTGTRLPAAEEDEFYLADLVGLAAFAPDGTALGTVATVHDYGAGASLEIGSLLVPFTRACVPDVDVASRRLVVVMPEEITLPGIASGPDTDQASA